ncbi:MAG TPA: hypothetical protein PKO15_19130 [Fibrobacteria bacterium]|nr:hypothetical protein [Fibrobacteria bacterium]HOX53090.1 hypothetical protein [Fibrobacteria bacterium]
MPPSSHDIGPITLRGETVRIPARIYLPEPSQTTIGLLTERQRQILLCLFTRHVDGFVRERMVKPLLAQCTFWTVPFVVQLLGEYVLEILHVLKERLRPDDETLFAEFLQENPRFWSLTGSRIGSYWNCYFRHPYPDFHKSPGHELFATLEGWRAQRSMQHTSLPES